MYILQLMDNYCASFSALIIGLTEVTVIAWIYGVDRFLDDARVMLGEYPYPKNYWKALWSFITPGIIVVLLMMSFVDMKPTSYGDYIFPAWTTPLGWFFSLASVSAIPIVALHKLFNSDIKRNFVDRFKILIQPTADWGPKLQIHRMETLSPKHTDSQVPLAAPYELDDNDSNDSNDSDDMNTGGGQSRPSGYILPDDPSDVGGIRLEIGGSMSPDSSARRLKANRFTNETHF